MLLFVCDAVASLITAIFVYFALHETRSPSREVGEPEQTITQTFKGYREVMRDAAFVWFLVASGLMVLVYMQMNTTLAVYLRDAHGVTPQGFGFILSLNAIMVVLFQFSITRRVNKYRPLMVMGAGTLLYAVGFAMFGFVSWYGFFLLAMAIITIGEMMVSPVGQAIVARLAPEDMRGRYMAVYGFSWVLPFAIGPLLAGLIMDNFNPDLVWISAGLLGLVAAGAFYLLEWRVGRSRWAAIDQRLGILERLEEGKISAEEAGQLLANVEEGSWSRLNPPVTSPEKRHFRIRVSDIDSGAMKVDLHLPASLVNTVLYVGGHLSTDLEDYDPLAIQELIDRSAAEQKMHSKDTGDERYEVSVE